MKKKMRKKKRKKKRKKNRKRKKRMKRKKNNMGGSGRCNGHLSEIRRQLSSYKVHIVNVTKC